MSQEKYDYLKSYDDYQLVNIFNRETSHNGWVSERAVFLKALAEALEYRNISLVNVTEKKENGSLASFHLRYPVFLREENGMKELVQITHSWREK